MSAGSWWAWLPLASAAACAGVCALAWPMIAARMGLERTLLASRWRYMSWRAAVAAAWVGVWLGLAVVVATQPLLTVPLADMCLGLGKASVRRVPGAAAPCGPCGQLARPAREAPPPAA